MIFSTARRATIAFCAASMLCHVALAQRTLLEPGMVLTYQSGGVTSPAWRVELVERNLTKGGRKDCLHVRFAPGGPKTNADDRFTCESSGVLFAWDSTSHEWRPSRPLAAGTTLDIRSGANFNRYSTAAETIAEVSGQTLRIIETTMVTTDSAGRVVRRLRERYAPALGTAASGIFETPDTGAPGGWRVVQEFKLVAIKVPAP